MSLGEAASWSIVNTSEPRSEGSGSTPDDDKTNVLKEERWRLSTVACLPTYRKMTETLCTLCCVASTCLYIALTFRIVKDILAIQRVFTHRARVFYFDEWSLEFSNRCCHVFHMSRGCAQYLHCFREAQLSDREAQVCPCFGIQTAIIDAYAQNRFTLGSTTPGSCPLLSITWYVKNQKLFSPKPFSAT